MPNKSQIEEAAETRLEHDEREAQAVTIRKQVLDALGRPANLRSVQVCKLWSDHYRINVLVGESVGSLSLAHSYFLVVDSEGNLITATPAITKRY